MNDLVLIPVLLVGFWALPVSIAALGAVLVARGRRHRRVVEIAGGVVLVGMVVWWGWPLVAFAQDEVLATTLPAAIVGGTLIAAHGLQRGDFAEAIAGAGVTAAALIIGSKPVFETSWDPPSLNALMRGTAMAWETAGASLFVLGVRRLRSPASTGWIPYATRTAPAVAAAYGFGVLVVAPSVCAVISNFGG